MCDQSDRNKIPVEEAKKKKNLLGSLCMKCKCEKAVVVVRVLDPLCKSCFLTYTTHKFRSTLGKSKLVQANDNVLIAVSGGHSSTALVHLVRDALSEGAHKRLRFSPAVICVDESAAAPHSPRQDYSHIEELAGQFAYPFYSVPVEHGFGKVTDDSLSKNRNLAESDQNLNLTVSDRNQFQKSFESIMTLTAQQDFMLTRRISIIVSFARENNFGKIMFADTATSLCMKILGNISLGRGGTIPLDVGVADKRYSDITIIRPMREFTSKEVAVFNRLRRICVQQPHSISTFKPTDSSLQKKTEEFIVGLLTDFPHTVNTVFRTADKVCAVQELSNGSTGQCCLCRSPILHITGKSEAMVSVENGLENGLENILCGDSGDQSSACCGSSDDCTSKEFRLTVDELKSHLCYGCKLIFRDMHDDMGNLPSDTLRYAEGEVKRQKMRESIPEFLLE